MKRLGKTPIIGIPNAEPGIFVSSIEYTPSCETLEQLDHKGEVQGVTMYKEKVEFSMEGELPLDSETSYNLGAALVLQNACPASCWLDGKAKEHTTAVVTSAPVKYDREGAQTVTVGGTIYPFDSTPSVSS